MSRFAKVCVAVVLSLAATIHAGQVPWNAVTSAYQRMSLPVPAYNWQLCKVTFGPNAFLAFADPTPTTNNTYLVGQDTVRGSDFWQRVEWLGADHGDHALNHVQAICAVQNPFYSHVALATAIQCRMRGMTNVAERIVTFALSVSCGTPNGLFETQRDCDPLEATYRMGWSYWGNRLLDTHTQRSLVLTNMQYIVGMCPALQNARSQRLLNRLTTTLSWEGRVARGELVPDRIDHLIQLCYPMDANPAFLTSLDFRRTPEIMSLVVEPDADVKALLQRHINDERLTHAFIPFELMQEARHLTVGEIVSYILSERDRQSHAAGSR